MDAASFVVDEATAADAAQLDLDALSRQVATYDIKSQINISSSSIFIAGLDLLGLEIAKNICLSGPRAVTIHDERVTTQSFSAVNFFRTSAASTGPSTRADSTLARLKELNPSVEVRAARSAGGFASPPPAALAALLAGHDVLVLCDAPEAYQLAANSICREMGVKFISASVRGVFAWAFADFGDQFVTSDKVVAFVQGDLRNAGVCVWMICLGVALSGLECALMGFRLG